MKRTSSTKRKSGTEVVFDDETCYQCSRCSTSFRTTKDGAYHDFTAVVDVEIYPPATPIDQNVFVTMNFNRYVRPVGECRENETLLVRSKKSDFMVNWNDLEPLAVALGRAVANAKLKGFLPSTGASKGTPRTAA
jgi:hypothetical protein